MNSALNGVKYHNKEPQRFFNRFSFYLRGIAAALHYPTLPYCSIPAQ